MGKALSSEKRASLRKPCGKRCFTLIAASAQSDRTPARCIEEESPNAGPIPNGLAKHLIGEYLDIQQDEAKMDRSYVPKLSEVLPGAKAARYLQIETKIRAVVRYELAGRIPLIQ